MLLACTELSLKALLNELHAVRASWYKIGLQLDIPHTTLDCFKQSYSDQTDLMCEMLKHWLDTAVDPPPSWEVVVAALRSPIVHQKRVAEQLESKYCVPVPCMKEEPNSHSKSKGISILHYMMESNLMCRERLNCTLKESCLQSH